MKNKVSNLFMILAASAVLFTACKKEYTEPPIQVLPVGTIYTIGEILQMESGTVFTEDASVYGIITADEQSGNLYKCAFMQDRATGDAIELYLNAVSGVRIGDSVRIYLKDVTYSVYNNLPQLSNFEADGHIIILANNRPIQPELTTIANINAGRHLAGLVRLENVKFTEQNTFSDPTGYGNRTLADPTDYSQTVLVRTSNYANFAYDSLPQGTGNLVAIASVYGSTWQLYIRSASELEFNGYTPGGGGDVELPYYQDFTTSFGTYTTYNVEGAQKWEIDYSTAKITGYANGTNYANEDWLLSSPVALTGVDHVKVGVNYVAQYSNSNPEDVTLQISKDYVAGSDPRDANWKQMPVTYPNTGGWQDFQTVETSLDEFRGETVTVAIKFLSTETQSRTMEVKYILVEEGEPGGGGGGGSGTLEGDGSRENPYTADDIILLGIESSDGNYYWVKDFIVGAINPDNNYAYEYTSSTTVKTNLIISSNENASSEDECVPVQLPAGDVRTGLNLADNPGNYKQEVLLYGTLEKYFQKPSVKNVSYAEINGNSFGTDPNGGGSGGTEYFNQPLTSQASFNVFSSYSVEGEQTWNFSSSYGAVMSGFSNNVSYANEDWLVTPVIDLSASTNPVLVFDHTRGPAGSINVGLTEGYYSVWITNEYTNGEDPNQERWEELTGVNHTTTSWAWVSSGELAIPSGYKTSTCRIAFRYISIDGASATWEIKNVVVKEQ